MHNVQFQKISILPPQKGLEFPRGSGGSLTPKNLNKFMELNWNFPGTWGDFKKNPFRGGGMDIFWNYTIQHSLEELLSLNVIVLICGDCKSIEVFAIHFAHENGVTITSKCQRFISFSFVMNRRGKIQKKLWFYRLG